MHRERVVPSRFSRKLMPAGLAAALLVTGCGAPTDQDSAGTSDIYNNDAQTRRRASAEEMRWTVSMHGCTGSMLSSKYMLTANHCSPRAGARYISGVNLAAGKGDDLQVVRVAESNASMDYSIVEVRWISGTPTAGQKYTPYVSSRASDLTMGRDGAATKLVTVGFPVDKRQEPTYAEGYSKRYLGDSLYYNVGSINGNSGGAVWRASDYMLVSQTNFGNHAYRQPGWDNNNPEDANAWNGGAAFYQVYAQSRLLREIFPGGDNKFADAQGNLAAVHH